MERSRQTHRRRSDTRKCNHRRGTYTVTGIGNCAFIECVGLTSVTIPAGVTSIGRYAFSDCSGLTQITCAVADPAAITMGGNVFYKVPKTIPLYVPMGSKPKYAAADQWKDFTNIVEKDMTEKYPLWVAGVQVTSANAANITGAGITGKVSYDAATKTLTLDNVTTANSDNESGVSSSIDGLIIRLAGNNKVSSKADGMQLTGISTTISGTGTLQAISTGGNAGIYNVRSSLTIEGGCTVIASGGYGLAGYKGLVEQLVINGSKVEATGTTASIADYNSLTLTGCKITAPAGATYNTTKSPKGVYGTDGNIIKTKIVIESVTAPPAGTSVITLTSPAGKSVSTKMYAAAENTPVWVETAPSAYQYFTIGTSGLKKTFEKTGADLKIYGDITQLRCTGNELTALDVSGCTALEELSCYDNQLTALDVSGCTALTELGCNDNKLTALDVSGCTALTELGCNDNKLTTLDVSGCTALKKLWCYNNPLTALDVSGCTALKELWCYNNRLTTQALDHIYCALPARAAEDDAAIYVSGKENAGAVEAAVLNTNGNNAAGKNWKVTGYDNNTNTSYPITTTGSYSCGTGVAETRAAAARLYPNPVGGTLHVEADEPVVSVTIYDVAGRETLRAEKTNAVNVSALAKGSYFVKLATASDTKTFKIVKE